VHIRPAISDDANLIADIWNPVIRETITTFTSIEKTVPELEKLIAERAGLNHGFYVVQDANTLLGFATYGPFRNGPGYAHTMEHSVFLAPAAKRQGTGKALIETLENHARKAGIHSFIAGLSAENTGAIQFHANLGYAQVANIKQAGFKFDRWHDLVMMQKLL